MPTVSISVSAGDVITCSPDPVNVSGSNVTITFNLQASGYRFASSGAIVVPSPASQFPNASITVMSNQVTLLDVNSDANTYKYNVNLVRTSDNAPVSVDPTIKNGQ